MVLEGDLNRRGVLKTVLEHKLRKDIEDTPHLVDGSPCLYPSGEKGCRKPMYAGFKGIPLCKEHWDLTQWISYIIYKVEEDR